METTIKQQVALDEALVPSTKRLRLWRSNFRLPSDIQSKESTLDDILFSTIKVVSRHQNTQQYGAILPIKLTTEDIRNTKTYKEYYACATGEAALKPKGEPITTVAATPRLTAATKRKQPARATSPTEPSEHGGFSTDEGTDSKPGVLDVPSDDSDEETSWNSSDEEDVDDQTKGRDDNEGLRISEEERIQEEEEADELYRDQESSSVSSFVTSMLNQTTDAGVESIFTTDSSPIAPLPTPTPIMTPSTIATITTTSEAPIPPITFPSAVLKNLPTFDLVFCFEDRVKALEVNFSEFMQTNQFAEAVSKIPADLIEMELKKILIEKMEGNKFIQRSDKQRNLYKALVDAYEADKTILESYGDTAILKRRRGDDDD
nr:hypothetical protein [Tanacetum cinerariifolium]